MSSYQSDAVRMRARAAFDVDDGDLGALLMYRELEERLEGLEDVAALLLMEDDEVDVAEAAAVLGERLGGEFYGVVLEDAIVAVLEDRGVVSKDRKTVTGLRLNY